MFKFALPLALMCAAVPASADFDKVAQLEVISGWTTENGTRMTGLNITLAPGWKTYWRAPGDGGIPPVMNLSGSENIATAQFHWPVPEVFDQNGMRSIGYSEGVVLPVELAPRSDGDMHISGSIQIGVCQEICVPVTLKIDAALPSNAHKDPRLVAALLDRPQSAVEAGVTKATCSVEPISDGLRVMANVSLPHTGGVEAMVIETGDPDIWVSESETLRDRDTLIGMVEMVAGSGQPFALDRSAVRITILGRNKAVDVIGCRAH